MVLNSGDLSSDSKDVAMLILFSLSFLLGGITAWILQNVPLISQEITIYRLLIVGAAGLTIISGVIYIFFQLSRIFVINPIREDLQEATVVYDGDSLRYNAEATPDDFSIPGDILQQLGYSNVADGMTEADDDSSEDTTS